MTALRDTSIPAETLLATLADCFVGHDDTDLPSEQRLAERFLVLLDRIFPGKAAIVRLFGLEPPFLRAVAASAEVGNRRKDLTKVPVVLPQSVLADLALNEHQVDHGYVQCGDVAPAVMGPGYASLIIPLVRGQILVGAITVEAPGTRAKLEPLRAGMTTLGELLTTAVMAERHAVESIHVRGRLDRILDQSSALVLMLDLDRKIRLFNRALTKLTQYKAEEVIGRDVDALIAKDERERFCESFHAAIRGQARTGFDVVLVDKQGQLLRTLFSLEARFHLDGSVESVLGIGQDVTPLRDLQHQVIHAEKLSHVGRIAAGVVHELNTPLTSISVYAEYLLQRWTARGEDPDDLRRLSRIVDGAARIHKLTRNLLEYARHSGDEPVRLSFNEVVDEAVSFCEHLLERANVHLDKVLGKDVGTVYGTRDQLQQMAINLIANACDAMTDGGTLHVATENNGNDTVSLSVADTGVGIEDQDMVLIFEPFFSTKTQGGGTGLGLCIVKNIVEFHQGTITVRSDRGEGTCFRVTLPRDPIDSRRTA